MKHFFHFKHSHANSYTWGQFVVQYLEYAKDKQPENWPLISWAIAFFIWSAVKLFVLKFIVNLIY